MRRLGVRPRRSRSPRWPDLAGSATAAVSELLGPQRVVHRHLERRMGDQQRRLPRRAERPQHLDHLDSAAAATRPSARAPSPATRYGRLPITRPAASGTSSAIPDWMPCYDGSVAGGLPRYTASHGVSLTGDASDPTFNMLVGEDGTTRVPALPAGAARSTSAYRSSWSSRAEPAAMSRGSVAEQHRGADRVPPAG